MHRNLLTPCVFPMRTIMKRIAMLGIVFLLATSAAMAQQRGGHGQREGRGQPEGRQAGVAAAGATAKPAIKPTHADVVYVTRGNQDLKLDAYLADSDKPTPAMVYIHGGGWRGGGKALGTRFPMFLLEQGRKAGISIFSIQYRLTGVEPHPAQRLDCERAIQFIRYKAKEWNIDPERIGVMGNSAGAHLSLLIGLRDDQVDPKSSDPVQRQSTRVSCIVNCSGCVDLRLFGQMLVDHPSFRMYLDVEPGTRPDDIPDELIADASPLTFATRDDPPVLTLHGAEDTLVSPEQAKLLDARLKELGVPSTLTMLDGVGQGIFPAMTAKQKKDAMEFIRRHLLAPLPKEEGVIDTSIT